MAVSPVCVKCGTSEHAVEPCSTKVLCVNCEGDHASNFNKCPTLLKQRDLQKIRVSEVSFPDAKRRYLATNTVDLSRSFASTVTKPVMTTSSSQTETLPSMCDVAFQVSLESFTPTSNSSTPSASRPNKTSVAATNTHIRAPTKSGSKPVSRCRSPHFKGSGFHLNSGRTL